MDKSSLKSNFRHFDCFELTKLDKVSVPAPDLRYLIIHLLPDTSQKYFNKLNNQILFESQNYLSDTGSEEV